MSIKCFNVEPRLKIYQIIIGEYDLIDKYTFSEVTFRKIKNIKLIISISKLVNKSLYKLLIQEFLTQKFFNFDKSFKFKFKNFVITLRGD